MTRRKAVERWETTIGNCEATPQAMRPIGKSLMKRDGPKAPTAVRGPLSLTYHPKEKANAIAITCVMKTVNDGWRLEHKLCSHL
jgi:hypothetical protein